MTDYDILQDEVLKIHTTGRDDSESNFVNFPYEPTPYKVLERIAQSGLLEKKNTLLDYGCGKGRVGFCLSFLTKCHSIGIEYNERLFHKAMENHSTALSRNRVSIELCNAEDYIISNEIDRVFYFNPFCVDILKSTIKRLKDSLRIHYREIILFFYYPSEKYEIYLSECKDIIKICELDCKDIFPEDAREKISIFKLV